MSFDKYIYILYYIYIAVLGLVDLACEETVGAHDALVGVGLGRDFLGVQTGLANAAWQALLRVVFW